MKFAFIFPGQGSQAVGMLNDLMDEPVVANTLAEASSAIDVDIARLVREGPKESLDSTVNTQPVMLATSIAIYRLWCERFSERPAVVAGHSLGEYSALVAAGVLAFSDAVSIVRFRAQAMQDAVPLGTGGMAAVLGLDDRAVIALCQEARAQSGEVVEAVNFNAPAQVVIAGSNAGLERACALAKAAGAKRALPLPVSAPFHSSLLVPASERLAAKLTSYAFAVPRIAVVNNVDVKVETDPLAIRSALVRQVANPVRWTEVVQKMAAEGVELFVECGAGKVLTGLVKRIAPTAEAIAINDQAGFKSCADLLN